MHVAAPTKVTNLSATGAVSNIGLSRQTMNTPAVTMVAAWISAETGVGPLHRVGQPGVEAQLRRFAHRADEQQDAQHIHGRDALAEEADRRSAHGRRRGKDFGDRGAAEHHEGAEDTEHESPDRPRG